MHITGYMHLGGSSEPFFRILLQFPTTKLMIFKEVKRLYLSFF